MSDLVADFLAREQEQLGDFDEFKFDEIQRDTIDSDILTMNDDFKNFPDTQDFSSINTFQEDDSYVPSSNNINKSDFSMPRIEPEKILVWRREFEARIQKKDEEELVKVQNLEKEATKELEDWNSHHNEQLLNKRKLNRESQGVFVKERDQPLPGSEWQRVCKMCEFSSRPITVTKPPVVSNGEHGAPVVTAKDTSRMKSILLSLKTNPLIRA